MVVAIPTNLIEVRGELGRITISNERTSNNSINQEMVIRYRTISIISHIRVANKPRDVKLIMHLATEIAKTIVVVREGITYAEGTIGGLTPLSDMLTLVLLRLDDDNSITTKVAEADVTLLVNATLGEQRVSKETVTCDCPSGVKALEEGGNVSIDDCWRGKPRSRTRQCQAGSGSHDHD